MTQDANSRISTKRESRIKQIKKELKTLRTRKSKLFHELLEIEK